MPAEVDQLSSLPRLQELAYDLRVGVNELRVSLSNQGLTFGPDDRVPPEVVHAALEREIEAGRPWQMLPLERHR